MTQAWTEWDKHADHFPRCGPPGIHHVERQINETVVDCLVSYDAEWELVGLFYHYNRYNIFNPAGQCHCLVRPDRLRQGVASDMLRVADKLWLIREQDQRYNEVGNAFVEGLIAKGKIDPERTTSLEGLPDSVSGQLAKERSCETPSS